MGNGASWLILQIEMGYLGGWGTWPMGYMGNGAHGHNLVHMGNGKHGQRGIMVNTSERDGAPWGMGHIGDGAHGQWGTWTMGHMGILRTDGQWQTWSKGIMVNTADRDGAPWWIGTWVMRHMANGAHRQWGTWV